MASGADVDVAIIGAGAAGIAAARRLTREGLTCRLLEARERIGGRAWTDGDSLGLRFDRGCAWLHDAGRNPVRPLAAERGITCSNDMTMHFHLNGGFAEPAVGRDVEQFLERNFEAMAQAGADIAAAEVIDHGHPYSPVLDNLVAAINGVEAGRYSTGEAAVQPQIGDNLIVREGLGTLISGLAQGLPVARACAVHLVDHRTASVRLETARGTLTARAVIVTVSTGVLRAGSLGFRPELPDWKLAALQALPMGQAEKVGLRFDGDVFGLPENSFINIVRDGRACGFHLRPFGYPVAIWFSGGQLAEQVGGLPPREAEALGLDYLAHAFGSTLRRRLKAGTVTAWRHDPWSLGAYSAALPGGHGQREALARPLAPRLFFAGEATHPRDFATVHGAWQSGERAATEMIERLGSAD